MNNPIPCPECDQLIIGTAIQGRVWWHSHRIGKYHIVYQRIDSVSNRISVYDDSVKDPFISNGKISIHLLITLRNKWFRLTEDRINTILLLK